MLKNFFFDYFYYRLYHLNTNKGKYQGYPAIVVISLIQSLMLAGLEATIIRYLFSRDETAPYSKVFSQLGVFIILVLIVYNYRKFVGKENELTELWKKENRSERILKGFLIALTIVLSFMPSIIIGMFF